MPKKMKRKAKKKIKNTADITKIRVAWDKNRNLSLIVPEFNEKSITKRNILSYITSIFDRLSMKSTSHPIGKVIYRDLCDKRTFETQGTPNKY